MSNPHCAFSPPFDTAADFLFKNALYVIFFKICSAARSTGSTLGKHEEKFIDLAGRKSRIDFFFEKYEETVKIVKADISSCQNYHDQLSKRSNINDQSLTTCAANKTSSTSQVEELKQKLYDLENTIKTLCRFKNLLSDDSGSVPQEVTNYFSCMEKNSQAGQMDKKGKTKAKKTPSKSAYTTKIETLLTKYNASRTVYSAQLEQLAQQITTCSEKEQNLNHNGHIIHCLITSNSFLLCLRQAELFLFDLIEKFLKKLSADISNVATFSESIARKFFATEEAKGINYCEEERDNIIKGIQELNFQRKILDVYLQSNPFCSLYNFMDGQLAQHQLSSPDIKYKLASLTMLVITRLTAKFSKHTAKKFRNFTFIEDALMFFRSQNESVHSDIKGNMGIFTHHFWNGVVCNVSVKQTSFMAVDPNLDAFLRLPQLLEMDRAITFKLPNRHETLILARKLKRSELFDTFDHYGLLSALLFGETTFSEVLKAAETTNRTVVSAVRQRIAEAHPAGTKPRESRDPDNSNILYLLLSYYNFNLNNSYNSEDITSEVIKAVADIDKNGEGDRLLYKLSAHAQKNYSRQTNALCDFAIELLPVFAPNKSRDISSCVKFESAKKLVDNNFYEEVKTWIAANSPLTSNNIGRPSDIKTEQNKLKTIMNDNNAMENTAFQPAFYTDNSQLGFNISLSSISSHIGSVLHKTVAVKPEPVHNGDFELFSSSSSKSVGKKRKRQEIEEEPSDPPTKSYALRSRRDPGSSSSSTAPPSKKQKGKAEIDDLSDISDVESDSEFGGSNFTMGELDIGSQLSGNVTELLTCLLVSNQKLCNALDEYHKNFDLRLGNMSNQVNSLYVHVKQQKDFTAITALQTPIKQQQMSPSVSNNYSYGNDNPSASSSNYHQQVSHGYDYIPHPVHHSPSLFGSSASFIQPAQSPRPSHLGLGSELYEHDDGIVNLAMSSFTAPSPSFPHSPTLAALSAAAEPLDSSSASLLNSSMETIEKPIIVKTEAALNFGASTSSRGISLRNKRRKR